MTIWTPNQSDALLSGFTDPEGDRIFTYSVGSVSGSLTTIDWNALTSVVGGVTIIDPYIFFLNGFRLRLYQGGMWDYDDEGNAARHPLSGTALLGRIYFKASDGVNLSAEHYRDINFEVPLPSDVTGPVASSINPSHQATGVAINSAVEVNFNEPIVVNSGVVKVKVKGGADIQSWTLPGAIGAGVTISGSKLTMTPSSNFANDIDVAPYIAAGAVKDVANNGCSALTDDSLWFRTIPSGGGGSEQPLPAPFYPVWDFDHVGATYNTSTDCATWGAVNTALTNALNDPGTVGVPKYHKIRYTGGPLTGDQDANFTGTKPTEGSVYILIEPTTTYQTITGSLRLINNTTFVKFAGWQIQPNDVAGGDRTGCVGFGTPGIRAAFYNCRMGLFWRAGYTVTNTAKPDGFNGTGGSDNIRDCRLKVEKCDIRDVFELLSGRPGYYHFIDTFVTGLVDDWIFIQTAGLAPRLGYVYLARNIIMDMADDPSFSGNHTDAIQLGATTDVFGDSYHCEAHQNIYVGNNYRQYATHGLFLQLTGGARSTICKSWDNIWLVTGYRGVEVTDKRLDLQRVLCAWPPLAGALADPGNINFGQQPRLPQIRTDANYAAGQGSTPVIKDAICESFNDLAGWGFTPTNVRRASPMVQSGALSYPTVFPNLGAVWDAGVTVPQMRITPAACGYDVLSRDRASVRAWISFRYMPSGGWAANGLTDPVTWAAP